MSDTSKTGTPWHLWVVGGLALLWSGMGAFDYLMTQTHNEAYMAKFTQEQLDFFYGFPTWVEAFWAIGVWGGVAGSLLLLFRKKQAVWVYLASLVGAVVTTFQNYVLSNGLEVMGDAMSVGFTALIILFALGLYFYSRAMAARGVIR